MPGVLLRALSEYKFYGTSLWMMSDRKDLVRVELTFQKRRAESRRQPHQPVPASRPPPHREPRPIERRFHRRHRLYTRHTTDHQITLQEHRYRHRIADHHKTSVSRVSASEEGPEESLQPIKNGQGLRAPDTIAADDVLVAWFVYLFLFIRVGEA